MQHKDPLIGSQNQPVHPNWFDECTILLLLEHGTCRIYRGSLFLVQLILTPKQKQPENMILLFLCCHHLGESLIWMLHFQLLLILLDPTSNYSNILLFVQMANLISNWDQWFWRCGNICSRTWFNTMSSTWTEYTRFFLFIVIYGVLFLSALILPIKICTDILLLWWLFFC